MGVYLSAVMDQHLAAGDVTALPERLNVSIDLQRASARLIALCKPESVARPELPKWAMEPDPEGRDVSTRWREREVIDFFDPITRASLSVYRRAVELRPGVRFGLFQVERSARDTVADMAVAIARIVSSRAVIYVWNAGFAEGALDLLWEGGGVRDVRKALKRSGFEAAYVDAHFPDSKPRRIYLIERVRSARRLQFP
jgi:hypothetical protein